MIQSEASPVASHVLAYAFSLLAQLDLSVLEPEHLHFRCSSFGETLLQPFSS